MVTTALKLTDSGGAAPATAPHSNPIELLTPPAGVLKMNAAAALVIDETESIRQYVLPGDRSFTVNALRQHSGDTTYDFTLSVPGKDDLIFTLKPNGSVTLIEGKLSGNPSDELGSLLHETLKHGIS